MSRLNYVMVAKKNRLIETVLFSTHSKCFGWEIRKNIFTGGLIQMKIKITSQMKIYHATMCIYFTLKKCPLWFSYIDICHVYYCNRHYNEKVNKKYI